VRFLDAVDEERSEVYVRTVVSWLTGRSVKRVSHGIRCADVFRQAVVNGHHIFRAFFAPATIFCDEAFAAAAQRADLRGIRPFVSGATDG
jgi:hypothetical protein